VNKRQRLIALAILSALFLSFSVVSAVVAAEQPGNPAYIWLNGKWTGPAPGGGTLEMELRVVNDNQITGSARIAGGRKGYSPSVSGSVNNDKVQLELYNPSSGNNVKFDLSSVEGILKGTRKGEEVTFKKQQ